MKVLCPFLFVFLAVHHDTAFGQNEKWVIGNTKLTPAQIAHGAYILYLIKFQNLESDTAFSLLIRDTLDPKLDYTTIEMVDASHAYEIVRGGEVIRWFFNDINLPGNKINATASKGHIMFRVKVKQGLTPGQVIRNRATILFNPFQPIRTNETAVWIDQSGTTSHPSGADEMMLSPNPNHGIFQTTLPHVPFSTDRCWIIDGTGRQVSFTVMQEETGVGSRIVMHENTPGYYFFQVRTNQGMKVIPFVVVR